MDKPTAAHLNRMTRRFYDVSSRGFTAGRELARPGWLRLLRLLSARLERRPKVTVLDIGCGPGRFCDCLSQYLERPFGYLGLDASPGMVALARDRLTGLPDVRCRVFDVAEESLPNNRFTLVSAFGLLHHIPGYANRRQLLEEMCFRVEPGGSLLLSVWHRRSQGALLSRTALSEGRERDAVEALNVAQLEPGDRLVCKSNGHPRYCHFVDADEEKRLLQDLPLKLTAAFDSDGRAAPLNRYFLLSTTNRPQLRGQ